MIDRFSRKIDYMRISITDRCNLRCRYCMPENGVRHLPHREILSYEEILRLVRVATGCSVTKIRVTGGEPLTRRGIIYFMRQIKLLPYIDDVTITTNGILLPDYAGDLVNVGVKRVNISLDTLKPEKFRYITRMDLFERVLEGIRSADEAGLSPVKINCVAIKGFNDEEILDFARLTLDHPYHVRFIEFMPLGENDYWRPDKALHAPEIMDIIGRVYPLEPVINSKADQNGPARRFRIKGGAGEIGLISPISRHFCDTCNRIRLTPDGRLRNCLFSDQETNIKEALRSGAKDEELARIIRESIQTKPSGHKLQEDASHKCKRSMWKIGG
ncbi:GTP 3',8-cyclase MoaA [bacterium]|nr:GTP 3',8-cyclase MoaA [bacterium]